MGNLTHTVSGDIASFRSAARVPIESLKCHFLPIQEGTGDPSPENVRPITGWQGINVYQNNTNSLNGNQITIPVTFPALGKNLLDKNEYGFKTYDSLIFGGNNSTGISDRTLRVPAGTYTFSTNTTMTVISMTHETGQQGGVAVNTNQLTFTCNENESIRIVLVLNGQSSDHDMLQYNYQLELSDTATAYEPFNNTVYGGYVDIAKGEIVATHILLENLWSEWTLHGTQTNTVRKYIILPYEIYPSSYYNYVSRISNIARYSYSWTELDETHFYVSSSTRIYMWLPINTDESTKVQVIGTLLNPIHYPLSKTELKTFLDQNNIWSNTNDITEVSYQIHDSIAIQTTKHQIAMNEPYKIHVNNTENIDINLAVPKIKGLKLYFSPIYRGSGTPSGTNVYDLRPWGSISIYIDEQRFDKSLMQTYPCSGYYDYDSGVLYYDQIMQTLDGSTGITSYSNRGSSSIFWGYVGNLNIYNSPEITLLSNMFTWAGYNYNYDTVPDWSFAGSSTYPNSFWMKVPNDVLSELSLNGAKTWLSNNPVKVIAPRKDGAVTTNIESMDINVTRGIHNFNTLNIWAPIKMEFDYWAPNY